MRQLPYNNSAATLRFEYPLDWDSLNVSGVNIKIDNLEGGALLASSACTVPEVNSMSSATSVGGSTITIDVELATYLPGDRLLIDEGPSGPSEEVEVLFCNTSTGVTTLKHELKYAHGTGSYVYALFCTYNLNTSTVATWTKGLQCVITWTPTGSDDIAIKERAEVAIFDFAFPDFARRFEILYPREWRITEYRTKEILEEATLAVQMDLSSKQFNIHRLINQEMIQPVILAKARWIVVRAAGNQWADEREVALDEYNKVLEVLLNQPIWLDENQDSVRDESEIDEYVGFLGLERGF